jgi:hypothetical protein
MVVLSEVVQVEAVLSEEVLVAADLLAVVPSGAVHLQRLLFKLEM